MKHFVIAAGGSIDDAFAADFIHTEKPDCCIAADAGMDFFYRVGMIPHLIVGDFDSASDETLKHLKRCPDIVWETLNPVKDDTDMEYAVRKAVSMGAEKITLLGATGTRLDHVLGNIELLGIGLQYGITIQMLDAANRVRMIKNSVVIKKTEQYGKYVSLIPYTPQVTGVTLTGFRYPLTDFCLKGFCTLGISNEIVAEEAQINFENGILIVIESRD